MTVRFRALLSALIVVAVATGAALYIGARAAAVANAPGGLAYELAMNGNGPLPGGAQGRAELLAIALQRLDDDYYKPVNPQVPLAGERAALLLALRSDKIAKPSLPVSTATGSQSRDAVLLSRELADAIDRYGKALGSSGETTLTQAALRGVMNSVADPYTVYLSPKEISDLDEMLQGGNFGGIGVYIYQLKDGRILVQPIQQLPAANAGMKIDIVDSVDGHSVSGVPLDRGEAMIRGKAGSTVRLTTHPYDTSGAERTYTIVRQIIHVPTVSRKMEGNIEYIRLSDFGDTSANEVRKALLYGRSKGAKGYILDLRDNGGGYLKAAVDISSFFIPQGTIVATIDRNGRREAEEAEGDAIGGLGPLVVLVNKYSASASEITTGALQDYHLATVIGTKTYGKGVVQNIFQMPDSGALKITTARYVTPLGRYIQHKGLIPDITIEQNPDPSIDDTKADKQLAAAKARLQQEMR